MSESQRYFQQCMAAFRCVQFAFHRGDMASYDRAVALHRRLSHKYKQATNAEIKRAKFAVGQAIRAVTKGAG